MVISLIIILVAQKVALGNEYKTSDADIDSVINLLLSEDDIGTDKPIVDEEEDQPTFSGGIWKCGNCDVIDENKLVYKEVNDVDANDITDERPIVVQVGLTLDGMQCVTVSADGNAAVRKETGACASDSVTLAVYNTKHFLVRVYGL